MATYEVQGEDGNTYEVEGEDQPSTMQSISGKIGSALNFINNPGPGMKDVSVNDMDDGNPWSTMANLGSKAGQLVGEGVGKLMGDGILPNHPDAAHAIGNALSFIGSLAGGTSLIPEGSIDFPTNQATQNAANNFARRALGVGKSQLKNMAGGEIEVNAKAGRLLNAGVVTPFASPEEMIDRATDLSHTSGEKIGEILDSAGESPINTNDIASTIIDQLAPNFTGGEYDARANVIQKILDTVNAHAGDGGNVPFQDAQELKKVLLERAGSNWTTDKVSAALHQRAYGIVNDKIEKGVEAAANSGKIPPESYQDFLNSKADYGASKMALDSLRDKSAAEAANNILSLKSVLIGSAALAKGDITPALEALGVFQLAERYGSATSAVMLKHLSHLSAPLKSVAIANILSQGRSSQLLPTSLQPANASTQINSQQNGAQEQ